MQANCRWPKDSRGGDRHRFFSRDSMGLKFGAFDFIEKPDGDVVFLECNPNGQYGWLEEELGLPISEAVAAELIKIAKQR